MKIKHFGNDINSNGNNIEFYRPDDNFSARTLNRPNIEAYEDVENIYMVLQNICKTLYGQKGNGILPDAFEEMNKANIKSGYFFNNPTTYIRIPTGAFFAKLTDKQAEYYTSSYEESNQYSRDFYIDNDRNSAVIFNRPNTELFERQIADHFNIDLNDQDNDIKLLYDVLTDSHISSLNENSTEQEVYLDIEKKYSRVQKIRYYMQFTSTAYDYKKKANGGTTLVNTVKTDRVPIDSNQYCENVFDLVKNVKANYGNYLMKEDDEFSLEELIPVDNSKDSKNAYKWNNGEYIIFFNPNTTSDLINEINFIEGSGDNTIERKSPITYSKTKRFGMMIAKDYLDKFGDDTQFIKLFKIYLNFEESVSEIRRCEVDEIQSVSYLKKIDRTTLDIKNINLTNALNGLIIEKNGKEDIDGNINIGESHISPEEDEKDNISIGLRNLGYPQLNNTNQDPTLLSQRYKKILGSNNISLGTNSMRNTSKNSQGSKPENNIAIGQDALINVGYGKNNIEIGKGNGKTTNTNSIINIGNNITSFNETSSIEFGEKNVIVGYGNVEKAAKLGSKNTIIGLDNNSSTKLSINSNNIVAGENKISTIASNNIIIGKNNSETEIKLNSNNTIIGSDNISNSSIDNNYIIGKSNSYENTSSNNYTFGFTNSNTKSSNSFIIGEANENSNSNNYIIGKGNNISGTTNLGVGDNNTITSSNSFSIGSGNTVAGNEEITVGIKNNVSNSNNTNTINIPNTYKGNNTFGTYNIVGAEKNTVIGIGNNVNSSSNVVIGSNNTVKSKENNIILSNGITTACEESVVIGCKKGVSDLSDNQLILGPLGGTNVKPDGKDATSITTKASTIKIDGSEGTVDVNFVTLKFTGNQIEHTGNFNTSNGKISTDKFLSQNKLGSSMWINDNNDKGITGNDDVTLGVPIAGNTNNLGDLATYKTFVGTIEKLAKTEKEADKETAGNYDVISIRNKNGKSDEFNNNSKDDTKHNYSTNGSIIYVDRADGRVYSDTQTNSSWDTTYSLAIKTNNEKYNGDKKDVSQTPRQLIDTVGGQTIEGLMTFRGSICCPSALSDKGVKAQLYNGVDIKGNFILGNKDEDDTKKENNKAEITIPTTITNTFTVKSNTKSTNILVQDEQMGNTTVSSTTIGGDKLTINPSTSVNLSSGSFNIKGTKTTVTGTTTKTEDTVSIAGNRTNGTLNLSSTSTTTLTANSNKKDSSGNSIANTMTIGGTQNGTVYSFVTQNGYMSGNLVSNGTISAITFKATSARSQKKNIAPTKYKALEEINKINIVDFNFKTDINNEEPKVGFIADDTDEIFSTKTKDKMDIYNCIGMLMKAVQELSSENKELREQIKLLQK